MIELTSEPGRRTGPGVVEGAPVYCLDGVRHKGGVSPVQALVWNVRTCRLDMPADFGWLVAGELQAAGTVRGRVPVRGTGADRLVVAVMSGNAGGAKETGHRGSVAGQPLFGGRNR